MSDITVYGIPFSPFVRTVRMVLEEKGVGYQLVPSMPHSDEIYAINPFGKVPAFQHDEITMYETVAISTYVEGVFDGPSLVPSDNLARAHMHKWVSIFNDSVAPVMGGGLIVQRLMMPKMGKEPDEVRIAEAIPKARHCLEVYDGALAGKDWLVGDAISLADLFAIPMFAYLPMIPEGDELLKGLPNLMRWYDANAARESFKNTVADVDM